MRKTIFWGGTGQCKMMRPILEYSKEYVLQSILDNTNIVSPYMDVTTFNGPSCYDLWKSDTPDYFNYHFAVTIGNPHGKIRRKLSESLILDGLTPVSLIHHNSYIEDPMTVKLGIGIQMHAYSMICPFSSVGDYCILNTKSLVEHDCILESGVEIGPGAVVCGQVSIGENTWIGAGAVIRDHLTIGKNCIIGAGAVVVKDIPDDQIVVGNPAKHIKYTN